MSNFYPTSNEVKQKQRYKSLIQQANQTTRGKHTGSKSKRKLLFNAHRATSIIKSLMSGYYA